MPTQISSAIALTTTETATVGAALFRQRHTNGNAQIQTAAVALPLGRDRHMVGMVAGVEVFGSALVRRDRTVRGDANIFTETSGNKLASMPAVLAPTGKLWLNGKPLAEHPVFSKDQSLSLRLELLGAKLGNLKSCFKLFDLQGNTLIEKLETISPGGLEMESETIKLGGLSNFIGYIFVDRSETQFLNYPKEFEVEYQLEIGNSRVNYEIERGFLIFKG